MGLGLPPAEAYGCLRVFAIMTSTEIEEVQVGDDGGGGCRAEGGEGGRVQLPVRRYSWGGCASVADPRVSDTALLQRLVVAEAGGLMRNVAARWAGWALRGRGHRARVGVGVGWSLPVASLPLAANMFTYCSL